MTYHLVAWDDFSYERYDEEGEYFDRMEAINIAMGENKKLDPRGLFHYDVADETGYIVWHGQAGR